MANELGIQPTMFLLHSHDRLVNDDTIGAGGAAGSMVPRTGYGSRPATMLGGAASAASGAGSLVAATSGRRASYMGGGGERAEEAMERTWGTTELLELDAAVDQQQWQHVQRSGVGQFQKFLKKNFLLKIFKNSLTLLSCSEASVGARSTVSPLEYR